ncbi:metal ABC transporter substrate-binding protein [Caldicellulosiruptoraceae bacterium PP1]
MKIRKFFIISFLLIFSLIFTSCKQQTTQKSIWTTIYPIYSITKIIAQDKIEVYKVIKDGAEVHSFEPTTKDIAKMSDSLGVFYIGLIDDWAKKSLDGTQTKVYKVSKGIDIQNYDPHIWNSPKNAIILAKNIKDALSQIDKDNALFYQKNFYKFQKEMLSIDKELKKISLKAKNKVFLISHPSFGYLANEYNLVQYSITGLNEEEEPSPAKIREIIKLIKQKNIRYLLYDPNENINIIKPIINETKIKTVEVYGMGVSSSDMSKNQTYIGLMKKNLLAIKKALLE